MALDKNRFNALFQLRFPCFEGQVYHVDLVASCTVSDETQAASLAQDFKKASSWIKTQARKDIITPILNVSDEDSAKAALSNGLLAFQSALDRRFGQIAVYTAMPIEANQNYGHLYLDPGQSPLVLCGNLYPAGMTNISRRRQQEMLVFAEQGREGTVSADDRVRAIISELRTMLEQLVERILDLKNPKKVVREAQLEDALFLKNGIENVLGTLKNSDIAIFEPDFTCCIDAGKHAQAEIASKELFAVLYHFDVQSFSGSQYTLDLFVGIPTTEAESTAGMTTKVKDEWSYAFGKVFDDYALMQMRTMSIDDATQAIWDNLPAIRKNLAKIIEIDEHELTCKVMFPSMPSVIQTASRQFERGYIRPPCFFDKNGKVTGEDSKIMFPLDLKDEPAPPTYLTLNCSGFSEERYLRTIDRAYLYLPYLTFAIMHSASKAANGLELFAATFVIGDILSKIVSLDRIELNFAKMMAFSSVHLQGRHSPQVEAPSGHQRLSYELDTLPYVLHIHIEMPESPKESLITDLFSIVTIENEMQRENIKSVVNRSVKEIIRSANHTAIHCRRGEDKSPDLLYIGYESLTEISRAIAGVLKISRNSVYTVAGCPLIRSKSERYVMQEPDADERYTPLYLRTAAQTPNGDAGYAVILIDREGCTDEDIINNIQSSDTTELQRLAEKTAFDRETDDNEESIKAIGSLYQELYHVAEGHDTQFLPVDTTIRISAHRWK